MPCNHHVNSIEVQEMGVNGGPPASVFWRMSAAKPPFRACQTWSWHGTERAKNKNKELKSLFVYLSIFLSICLPICLSVYYASDMFFYIAEEKCLHPAHHIFLYCSRQISQSSVSSSLFVKNRFVGGVLRPMLRKPSVLRGFQGPMLTKPHVLHA